MSLIPQRFKGLAKLWNGHKRKGGRPSTSSSSSSSPTGPTALTSRTSKTDEVSEHSDIMSQMEFPSALLSTCSQLGSERGNDDFDDFIKKDPLAIPSSKTGGGGGRGGGGTNTHIPAPVPGPAPTNLKGQATTNMRSLLQKSESLRLPQHVDRFEPVDALCDFKPLDPRQRRRRKSSKTSSSGY